MKLIILGTIFADFSADRTFKKPETAHLTVYVAVYIFVKGRLWGKEQLMLNSKRKGCRGERELAAILREDWGYDCHRGQQFKGGADSPDVVGLKGVHIEVKYTERFNLRAALRQAYRDTEGTKLIPTVWHRSNRRPWQVYVHAVAFSAMCQRADIKTPIVNRVIERKGYPAVVEMDISTFMGVYELWRAKE